LIQYLIPCQAAGDFLLQAKQMNLFESAKEFRELFQVSDDLVKENIEKQFRLISEETKELSQAHDHMVHSGFQDVLVAAFLKECCDVIYVIAQYAAFLNIDIDEAYRRVHENNMAKVGPDGKPVFREDGKVLKPAGHPPVKLIDLVD
jgi:predicted HAD superfamily Cof-like phosphohydrolase